MHSGVRRTDIYCYFESRALNFGDSRLFEVMGAMELQRSEALRFPTPAGIAARRHPPSHAAVASSHIVQFYENDQFLCATVADFLADGIGAGQPTVVIATEPHRASITQSLH